MWSAPNETLEFSMSPGFWSVAATSNYAHSTVCVSWEMFFSLASCLELDTVRKDQHLSRGRHVQMVRKEDGLKDRAGNFPKKTVENNIDPREKVRQKNSKPDVRENTS